MGFVRKNVKYFVGIFFMKYCFKSDKVLFGFGVKTWKHHQVICGILRLFFVKFVHVSVVIEVS